MQRPATIRHRTSLFEDAVAIVEAEYAADLSLDDIARRVASSRRQLQRAYSEIGRTTFREHLTAVRMERAAELLRTRGLTVRDVTKKVTLKVEFGGTGTNPWGMEIFGFSAETEIDREAFGLTWNQALETGGVLVGKKIKIEIEGEAIRQA